MNETMSLLLATTILAVGGLGLYMYKSNDKQKGGEDEDDYEENYNEDNLFNGGGFWGSNDNNDEENYVEEIKSRSKNGKTKRRKSGAGTKRRY